MGFVKHICRQCGHRSVPMSHCGIAGCDFRNRDVLHWHCGLEREHGICTTGGCQTDPVPLRGKS
jgi:hypothetical protein